MCLDSSYKNNYRQFTFNRKYLMNYIKSNVSMIYLIIFFNIKSFNAFTQIIFYIKKKLYIYIIYILYIYINGR